MDIDSYLESTLYKLGAVYHEAAAAIPPPVVVDIGGDRQWRYQTPSESLACFLKGIKVVSSLNASMVLLPAGYAQEIGALRRMINDYIDEILFLCSPQDDEDTGKRKDKFLKAFFQEEFDIPTSPLESTQKRDGVLTKKIYATITKMAESEANPSDAQEVFRTSHRMFSGYVHGAYPHIMGMFSSKLPELNGMPGRVDECRRLLIGGVHKALMVSIFVMRKLSLNDIEARARALTEDFERQTGWKPTRTAAEMLREMKRDPK